MTRSDADSAPTLAPPGDVTPLRPRRPRTAMLLQALPIATAFVALAGGPLAVTATDAAAHGPSNGAPHTAVIADGDPCHAPAIFTPMKAPECAGD